MLRGVTVAWWHPAVQLHGPCSGRAPPPPTPTSCSIRRAGGRSVLRCWGSGATPERAAPAGGRTSTPTGGAPPTRNPLPHTSCTPVTCNCKLLQQGGCLLLLCPRPCARARCAIRQLPPPPSTLVTPTSGDTSCLPWPRLALPVFHGCGRARRAYSPHSSLANHH